MTYQITLSMDNGEKETFYSASTQAAELFYQNNLKRHKRRKDYKIFLVDRQNFTCKIIDLGHAVSMFIKGVKYKDNWSPMQNYPRQNELHDDIYHQVDVNWNHLEVMQKKIPEEP